MIVSPATTGPADVVPIADKSACVCTVVEPEALLFAGLGSLVVLLTVAEFVIVVPAGVLGDTRTTRMNVAESPESRVAIVPMIDPVPPCAGLSRVNAGPEVCVTDTKVLLAGTLAEAVTSSASSGPAFANVTV